MKIVRNLILYKFRNYVPLEFGQVQKLMTNSVGVPILLNPPNRQPARVTGRIARPGRSRWHVTGGAGEIASTDYCSA